jgi:hypothetical protein
VRVVRLGSGVRVVLVPTLTCTPGADGRAHICQVLMGEIVTASGSATVDLGTATHIRRGLAFVATPQSLAPVTVKVGGRWRSLAMVSSAVRRVRCSTGSGDGRRTTTVRHRLVFFDESVAYSSCELTGHTTRGIGRLPVPLPPNYRA